MGKIFTGQTALKLNIDTEVDITSATVKLKYKKPDGSAGEFATIITVTDAVAGIIQWSPADSNALDVAGEWVFWVHITFPGGTVAAGESFCLTVYLEGSK